MLKKVRVLILLVITFLVLAFLAFHFIPSSEIQVATTGTLIAFSGMVLFILGKKICNALATMLGVLVWLLGISFILSLFPPIF